MKQYNRIMLGKGGMYADKCRQEGFIGADFDIYQDLSTNLPETWKEFNSIYIPIFMKNRPDKTKVAAGLSCAFLHKISKGLEVGAVILSPNGKGEYYVGEITGNYYYTSGDILPHRRKVKWYDKTISRNDMSEELKHSVSSIGTCCEITQYADEIEKLLSNFTIPSIVSTTPDIESPSEFAMEKYLEEFLIDNWKHTDLGKKFDIFEEDGEQIGRQYQTDTGPMDILAISKNKKTLLVIELKKGRASDMVVGQIQRYMGYVKEELLSEGQEVKGLIIGLYSDTKLKRALSVCNNIDFYRYKIDFKLIKD